MPAKSMSTDSAIVRLCNNVSIHNNFSSFFVMYVHTAVAVFSSLIAISVAILSTCPDSLFRIVYL